MVHQSKQRRKEVLKAVKNFYRKYGYAPSMRDIMEMTSITSTSLVSYYYSVLEKEGKLQYDKNTSRSVRLTTQ